MGRLGGNGLDVALEDKEVSGFDQDVFDFEGVVVLLGGDNAIVDSILAGAGTGDGALPLLLVAGIILVDSHDPGRLWVAPGSLARGITSVSSPVAVARGGGPVILDL